MSKNTSPAVRLKRAVVLFHLWIGLTLGLVWAVQGLTGALLVFHREVDRAALAAPPAGSLPLDSLIASAARDQTSAPESIGLYFADPGQANALGVFFATPEGSKKTVLVSTSTGEVLAERQRAPTVPNGNFARWLYNLHHLLLLGENGGLLVGASGLFLMTSALSGLWLGWPSRHRWHAAFAVGHWRTRLQQLFGWHRASGLLVSVALVLLTLSGAAMSFGKQLRELAPQIATYRAPYKVPPGPVPVRPIGADRAVEAARRALPEGQFVSVSLPTSESPAYRVRLRTPGEWRSWSGTSAVTVASSSGQVLDIYDASGAPLANKILESAFAVHSGEVAGLIGRVLTMLAGFSLPALYVTGVWAWFRKRRLRGRPAIHFVTTTTAWPSRTIGNTG